jgi:hypothetical protein
VADQGRFLLVVEICLFQRCLQKQMPKKTLRTEIAGSQVSATGLVVVKGFECQEENFEVDSTLSWQPMQGVE